MLSDSPLVLKNSNVIAFSYNWNNKLNNNAFTTFRLHNPNKYKEGMVYKIYLKDKYLFDAKIIDIKVLKLDKINDFISYLDTGYSKEEFLNIIKKMYKKIENLEDQLFDLILLKRV
ncbi:MAG: hypothetical protein KatS3mg068_1574 [Candidatus Sericytochromatia bacterium]|nr:MAG: hypothetical protein KatS3mg068_1574 [Candidatus Sericytochromatia bacterium]